MGPSTSVAGASRRPLRRGYSLPGILLLFTSIVIVEVVLMACVGGRQDDFCLDDLSVDTVQVRSLCAVNSMHTIGSGHVWIPHDET